MELKLAQRGRALMDFEVGTRQAANRLHAQAEAELASKGLIGDALPEDMDERHRAIDEALADSSAFRIRTLLGEWCWTNHGLAATEAYDEIRDEIADELAKAAKGQVTIHSTPDFTPPAYWEKSWFHRTHGGWDANADNGFIHGEIVHKKYVAKVFPGDIYGSRRAVAREAPEGNYGKILEIGTSSGHYTVALSQVFPTAEIWGIDPSPRMLEQAQRVGNELGCNWHLIVGVGEDTGLESESFDMMTAYAVHHEIPPRIVDAMFKEAYRLLRPGGTVLIADVPRYDDLDKLSAWRFDWNARYGGEPFWRATATMDFAKHAQDNGFTEVRSGTISPYRNPYFVVGKKPE